MAEEKTPVKLPLVHLVVLNEFIAFGTKRIKYTCYSCYFPGTGYAELTCKRRINPDSRMWKERVKEFRAAHPFNHPLTYEKYWNQTHQVLI